MWRLEIEPSHVLSEVTTSTSAACLSFIFFLGRYPLLGNLGHLQAFGLHPPKVGKGWLAPSAAASRASTPTNRKLCET